MAEGSLASVVHNSMGGTPAAAALLTRLSCPITMVRPSSCCCLTVLNASSCRRLHAVLQDIMRDAVTAADGWSYERAALEARMASGKATSAVTQQQLASSALLPNRRLQAVIDSLLHVHGFGAGVAFRPGPRAECLYRQMGASEQARQMLPQLCCPLTKVWLVS